MGSCRDQASFPVTKRIREWRDLNQSYYFPETECLEGLYSFASLSRLERQDTVIAVDAFGQFGAFVVYKTTSTGMTGAKSPKTDCPALHQ